jgi:hypothetical protein
MTDKKKGGLALALVHYPVLGHDGQPIATTVTPFDVHDLARVSATFGLLRYYVVTPLQSQQEIVRRLVDYWKKGPGGKRMANRAEALQTVSIVETLEDAVTDLSESSGKHPRIVTTSASSAAGVLDYESAGRLLEEDDIPWLLVFGTANGLADEILVEADYRLAPIDVGTGFNHLSVRSAVSIIIDRLCGSK